MTSRSGGARGGAVTVASQIFKLVLQVLSVSILARLLAPEDFGLVAMTAVFIQLGTLLRDFGMPTAAIQAAKLSNQQASNLFWINSGLGLAGAAVLVLVTPLVVTFYNEPRLGALMPIMASTLLLGGISAQSRVQLARSFRFTALAMIEVSAQVIGLIVAILGALIGLGYWSLAWQGVAIALSLVILQTVASRWLPLSPKRGAGTKAIVKRGIDFAGTGLLAFFSSNADTATIGARWGADSLGFYSRAFQILTMPIQAMMAPLTNVVVPVVNRAREDGRTVDSVLLRVQFTMGVTTTLVFLVAFVSAEYSIPLLLGPGWEATIPIFRLLAAGGIFQTLSTVSYWAFVVHDKSRALLHYNFLTKLLTVVAVVAGALHSVEMAAAAYTLSLAISWPINLIWLARSAGQSSGAYFWNGALILISAAVAAVAVGAAISKFGVSSLSPLSGFALSSVASVAIFLGTLVAMPGGITEIRKALSLIRSIRK